MGFHWGCTAPPKLSCLTCDHSGASQGHQRRRVPATALIKAEVTEILVKVPKWGAGEMILWRKLCTTLEQAWNSAPMSRGLPSSDHCGILWHAHIQTHIHIQYFMLKGLLVTSYLKFSWNMFYIYSPDSTITTCFLIFLPRSCFKFQTLPCWHFWCVDSQDLRSVRTIMIQGEWMASMNSWGHTWH